MAKGIRVNQLAKELGISSKQILDRCKVEGIEVPNHMTVIPLGLAETVRHEWFPNGGGAAVALEEAPHDERPATEGEDAAEKPKKPRASHHKRRTEAADAHVGVVGDEAHPTDEHPAPPAAVPTTAAPDVAPAATEQARPVAPPHEAPAKPETPATPTEKPAVVVEAPKPVGSVVAPATEAPLPTQIGAPLPPAPAAVAATAVPAAPVVPVPEAHGTVATPPSAAAPPAARLPLDRTQLRRTITLENRNRQEPPQQPERKPVVPAPQLLVPRPAQISGPRLVREEKPENLPAPRPRRPVGEGGGSSGPSFVTARPQAGRGVRVVDDGEGESDEARSRKPGAPGADKKKSSLSTRRRGPADGRRGEADEKIREFSEQDLEERRRRIAESSKHRREFNQHIKGSERHLAARPAERIGPIIVEEPITVKSLAAALGIKTNDILTKLIRQGVFANVNQGLDQDTAEMLALEFGHEIRVKAQATLEETLEKEFATRETDPTLLVTRPPVVTILGHVDHGKTSLLDKIRNAHVAAGEAGGITQHTAAWTVEIKGADGNPKRVTFIDTPGHQAFTSMRARGAQMTDVVVLVVAAVEGVMPQTIESINHARAAEVPIVVAMNKIDRPDANPDMVLGQLAAQGLNPVEWGGDIEVVRTSAVTGEGINELIEILDLQSQIMELKADPALPARGTVIEARMDEGLGAVATVLVQDGTLRVGDIILSGPGYGRIRSLLNDRVQMIQEAGPSTPVIVSGLDELPAAGDKFYVVDDLDRARSIAEERSVAGRQAQLAAANKVTTRETLAATIKEGEVRTINLIVKGDVQGSVETLVSTVTASNTEEVKVRVVHSGVGAINESDVQLAMATMSKPTDNRVSIIGFHVVPDEAARVLAEQHHVEIKLYRVIYEIFDDLKKALSGMLEPEVREKLHGHAEIRKVYKFSKVGSIAGCFVRDGHIQRGSKIRLIRNGVVITEDLAIESLKRVRDDVREVKAGLECGIKLAGYDDIKETDVLEAYVRETIQRTL